MLDGLPGMLAAYGAAAVFLASFVENLGVPFPAFPVLMLAGALSQAGGISVGGAVFGAAAGAVAADIAWYRLGQWKGRRVLSTLCKISLNPDACVEGAEENFRRRRTATILLAKFLPGVNTIVPPLAGVTKMPVSRFLLLDIAGAFAWAVAGVGLGWVFGAAIPGHAGAVHNALGWLVLGGIAAYVAWRAAFRYYLVHRYAVPRITPAELHGMVSKGEDVLVLDLRSDVSFEESSVMIPDAVRVRPATFHRVAHELPRNRDLVFYCT
ncbi:MAG: hypothetical protein FIA93_02875 [Deltaproteobacteria bacterium]|nr:hypothetical protein [Deltaproteobacteria bacterium]PWB67448.1 MAG: hypothetical protein C3F14_02110 [Deltaproteobacteria bacterium]